MKRKITAKTSKFCFKKFCTKSYPKNIQNNTRNILFLSIIISLLIISLAFFGCSSTSASSSSKIDVGDTSSIDSSEDSGTEDTKANGAGDESDDGTSSTEGSTDTESTSSTQSSSSSGSTTETTEASVTIKVYYANADGSALVGEDRIVGSSHKYLEAFLALTKPPINPGLVRLVPETTKVNKLTVKNGNIDLDLSKNIIDDRFKSDLMDILLVYSIVNTLTEFKEINTVTFYIDGKKGTSLGQVDISVPIFRDESYIQKN